MEKNLSISLPPGAELILNTLQQAGFEAFIVGGCVRDSLLGRTPGDWDITTSARPEEVKKLFRRTVDTGLQHGTVTVMQKKESYEITTYRTDGFYSDGRHPDSVQFVSSLAEDLARRDFTINAMAYEPRKGIVDLYGGLADLEAKTIRAVGNPAERFTEDALRMLRAVRFSAQLGFEIEEETWQAIRPLAPRLEMVSKERIRDEINKLLLSDHPEYFEKLSTCGITAVIMPRFDEILATAQHSQYHLYDVGHHTLKVMEATPKDLSLRLTALLHDTGKVPAKTTDAAGADHFKGHTLLSAEYAEFFLKEFRYDNKTTQYVSRLIRVHDIRIPPTPPSVRRLMSRMGPDLMPDYLRFIAADSQGKAPISREEFQPRYRALLKTYQAVTEARDPVLIKDLAVSGKDLQDAGIQPGPAMGEVLRNMLEDVILEPAHNTKAYLMEKYRPMREQDELPRADREEPSGPSAAAGKDMNNNTNTEKYKQALELIRRHDVIILHRHKMPDGDAIGAQVGLKQLIRDNYPEKNVYATGDSAARFDFLSAQPVTLADALFPHALCIILDCGGAALIADDRWQLAGNTIRFDHHLFQGEIAQIDISDSSFESTCGLLTDFALSCGLQLSLASALPLYMGMVTDSGRFRYDSTTPRTLRLAAALLEQGINTNMLFKNLYASTLQEQQQRAHFTGKIRFTAGGVAYLKNTAEEISDLQMDIFDVSRGMIGVMSDLKGVDIWVNFTESPEGIYAELRSTDLTIQPVAVKYGGGGHAKACGATLHKWEEADAMLADLDSLLIQNKG